MEWALSYVHEFATSSKALLLLLVSLCTIYALRGHRGGPGNLPPGPWGLPYFGTVPYLLLTEWWYGINRHEIMATIAARYGRVFSLSAFGRSVVALNTAEAVKDAFQRREMNDRPRMKIGEISIGRGVAFASGDCWKEQRTFTIRTLEKLGAGRPEHEQKIAQEVKAVLDEMAEQKAKPFDPKYYMMVCISNIISSLLYSIRHEYNDSGFKAFLDNVAEVTHLMGTSGAILSVPLLKYLPLASMERLGKMTLGHMRRVGSIIKTHRQNLDPDNPKDFTDAYLSEALSKKKDGEESHISDQNLPQTLIHIFSAGTENVATTLRWGLLYMIAYPEVQARIQEEIDRVVGRERMPQLSDEKALPYTQAAILELQRAATVAPLGVAHVSTDDFKLYGYTIPARTTVFANAWAIHYDPKVWKDPTSFNPERFLSEDGSITGEENMVSFSAGNRICIGRHLARMEIYLLFTHLLHRFTFRKANNSPPLDFRGHGSFARVPGEYLLQAIERS